MHGELIQFNSGDHVLGNKNVTEAIITDGDIVFNESYVVIGESLEAKNIHATYRIDKMYYKAKNIQELAVSFWTLNKYYDQLQISKEEAADKIFSSIGIRYSTVEHIWREYNG